MKIMNNKLILPIDFGLKLLVYEKKITFANDVGPCR